MEWIAHHRAIGVTDFLIYTNDCSDGTDTMLELLSARGWLTHLRNPWSGEKTVQWQALAQAGRHPLWKSAEWTVFLDCDEFINLRRGMTHLSQLLDAIPADCDAIAMPWRLFGNAGHEEISDDPVLERFQRSAPADIGLPLGHFFKTLFRPGAFQKPGVHRPRQRAHSTPNWADSSGNPLHPVVAGSERITLFGLAGQRELVEINHYSLKSTADFMVKRARGLPNRSQKPINLGYWVERNFNTEENTTISHMLSQTRAEHERLLADPELARLRDDAITQHRALCRDILTAPAAAALYWRLTLAGSSTCPQPEQTRAHLARLNAARTAES